MADFNLPPGCSVSDLPGNTPEDEAFEALFDKLLDSGLTAAEIGSRVFTAHAALVEAAAEVLKYWEVCKVKAPAGLKDQLRAALALAEKEK